MRADEITYMWLFVFFDLPVVTKPERRRATKFRKFLIEDGYSMVQFSVYSRVCSGQEALDKHIGRVQRNLPPSGSVRALSVTERQYGRMHIFVGKKQTHERAGAKQLVLL